MGVGQDGAHYLASDAMALAGVTDQIIYLEEGDVVDLQIGKYWIENAGQRLGPQDRPVKTVHAHSGAAELGPYRHFMQKEIFEQPRAGLHGLASARRDPHAPRGRTRSVP